MTRANDYSVSMISTERGVFSCIDYGGDGPDCILVHGTGQNALAWRDFAAEFTSGHHVVAFDMRGHGQTPEVSSDAEQYWRDIGAIASAHAMVRPIVIGHSTGAYAAMAYAAAGGAVEAIVCVDGFTLDSREDAAEAGRAAGSSKTKTMLFDMFRYGWRATAAERDTYIADVVSNADGDWMNDGVDPALLRAMLFRCFARDGDVWLRRPTLDEIAVVSAPDTASPVFPAADIYAKAAAPSILIWADGGLSKDRRADLELVEKRNPSSRFIALNGGHNLPMQQPRTLAGTVAEALESV